MLTWDDFPKVELEFMNHDHKECLQLINGLLDLCDDSGDLNDSYVTIDAALENLKQHFIDHFKREEQAMEETQFPPYYVHKIEHDSVLQQFQQVLNDWQSKRDLKALRRYIAFNIVNWLETHALTMDTVTAQHVARCS